MSENDFNAFLDYQVKLAFRRHGFTHDDIRTLSEGNFLIDVRKVIRGTSKIMKNEDYVDCDSVPSMPEGWMVEEHKKGFFMRFDSTKISFFLSKKQKTGICGYDLRLPLALSDEYKKRRGIRGHDLRQELSNKLVMNANLLDYLLLHPDLIPEEWSEKNIFFWGTIYRDENNRLCVRYLCKTGIGWHSSFCFLDDYFASDDYAAVVCLS